MFELNKYARTIFNPTMFSRRRAPSQPVRHARALAYGPGGLFFRPRCPTNRPFENKHISPHRLSCVNRAS